MHSRSAGNQLSTPAGCLETHKTSQFCELLSSTNKLSRGRSSVAQMSLWGTHDVSRQPLPWPSQSQERLRIRISAFSMLCRESSRHHWEVTQLRIVFPTQTFPYNKCSRLLEGQEANNGTRIAQNTLYDAGNTKHAPIIVNSKTITK